MGSVLNKLKTKTGNRILSALVLLVVFVILMILNMKTMYTADDFIYRFVYHTPSVEDHMQKITTGMIPYSMWNHYLNWNGRFVAHSVVQFFMQFDSKMVFNICNSLIYVLLVVMINRFATKLTKKRNEPFILALVFLFTWFYIPFFGQSVLWISGAGNYLWMSIIYLGFILYNLQKRDLTIWSGLIAAVLGFLTGASNENSGPAAVLIVLLFFIKNWLDTKKINWVTVIGVVFSGIGFISMMLSPGSQARGQMHRSILTILMAIGKITLYLIQNLLFVYLILVALLVLAICTHRITKDVIWSVAFFMIGHFAAIYVMALSPEYPDRTFFGGIIFLGVALFILTYNVFADLPWVTFGAAVLVSIFFVFSFIPNYHDISMSYYEVTQQMKKIDDAHGKSVKVKLITQPSSRYNAYNGTVNLTTDPASWMNVWQAKFYGVDSISGYY